MHKKTVILSSLLLLFSIAEISAQERVDTAYLSDLKTALRAVWPNNRSVNLVFHGHSVPAGYWHDHEVHTLESYPHLLLEKLNAKYPYVPINTIVTAVGGENAEKGELRFQEVLDHKPDLIFIDYALNDRGLGLARAKLAWEKMIKKAQAAKIKVILFTPTPDQRVDILAPGNELEQHATQIRQLAKQYHTGIVDSFQKFIDKITAGEKLESLMSHVNHPNKKGHEIVAEGIFRWF